MDTTNTDPEQRILRLDEHECWHRLLANQVGRIAFTAAANQVEILPLNYVVRGGCIVFRTTDDAGFLREQQGSVSFEIDGWDVETAWSVIATGDIERDPDPAALALETEIGLAPWAPDERGLRETLAVLQVHGLTGREFHRRVDEQARWFW